MSQEKMVLRVDEVGEDSPLHSLVNLAAEAFGQAVVEITKTGNYARLIFPVETVGGYFENSNMIEVAVAFLKDELIVGRRDTYKIQNAATDEMAESVREALGLD
jgi:hypothetical protein